MTVSALSSETVAEVLARYAVGGMTAPPQHGGGTANANVTVETQTGKYFLKRRNPKYARREYVAYDHRLMEHLAPFVLGTPLALPSHEGERWLEWEGSVYELYPYQEGDAIASLSSAQVASAGVRVAEFHQATRGFHGPAGKEWPRYQDPARIREGIQEMGNALKELFSPEDWAYLWNRVELLEKEYPDSRYHALPKTIVHGDYHPGNLKFRGDAVVGVFDLDWATEQPRLLDLADGVFLFAGQRQTAIDAADIVSLTQTWIPCPERTQVFMQGYLSRETVTDEEWAALPWAVCARWLFCRVAGRLKLPEERRIDYVVDGLLTPLRALDALPKQWYSGHAGQVTEAA